MTPWDSTAKLKAANDAAEKHQAADTPKGNAVVQWLHRTGRINLNDLVLGGFTGEDLAQFWQLLGYDTRTYDSASEKRIKGDEMVKTTTPTGPTSAPG